VLYSFEMKILQQSPTPKPSKIKTLPLTQNPKSNPNPNQWKTLHTFPPGERGKACELLSVRRPSLVDAAIGLYFGVQSTTGGAACVRVIPNEGASSKSNRSSSGLAN
jgi:hypothetical protein